MTEEKITLPWQAKELYAKDSEVYEIKGDVEGTLSSPLSMSEERLQLLIYSGIAAGIRMYGPNFVKEEKHVTEFKEFLHSMCKELTINKVTVHSITRSDGTTVTMPQTINWEVKDCTCSDKNTYCGKGQISGQFAYDLERSTAFINETMKNFITKFGPLLFEKEMYFTELKNYVKKFADGSIIESLSLDELTVGGNLVNFSSNDLVS